MAQPVWVLSVDLQTKTATFQSGMAEAARSARGAFTDIKGGATEMAEGASESFLNTRAALGILDNSIRGNHAAAMADLIRLFRESAAVQAALPFAATAGGVLLLVGAVAGAVKAYKEWKESQEKLKDEQTEFGTSVQNVFNGLDEKILQAGVRADELRNDHLGALRNELNLIDRTSMDELVRAFGEIDKAADTLFGDLKSHWYTFGIGSAGAQHALAQFKTQYDSLLSQGKDTQASDLLKGTLGSAQRILEMQKQAKEGAANGGTDTDEAWAEEMKRREAVAVLQKAGVGYTEKEMAAQQALVDALNAQVGVEQKVAALKTADKGNATRQTGNDMASQQAEAAREAAEHMEKMGELTLAAQKEQATVARTIHQSTIAERLAADIALADKEYALQEEGNQRLIAALDKGGKDYNNQLQSLRDKAAEIEAQHANAVADLRGKAVVEQYQKDIADMEEGEREKIDATQQGSAARLAVIDAAIKNEESKNLQATDHFRELLTQRVEVVRAVAAEESKARADAAKEAADNEEKAGELALAAMKEKQALIDSAQRMSRQAQMDEEINFANQEYALKLTALSQEVAALDKSGKDYENKLKELQDKQKQLIQQHENEITAIKDKAAIDQNQQAQAAMTKFVDISSAGLAQVIMGHESFAKMMDSIGNQVVTGMIQNALKSMMTADMDKEKQAARAARYMYNAGAQFPWPTNIVMAPVLGAAGFAAVMAFQDGTDMVPGVGSGDIVPAMLEPGEGVVPRGVMDGLRNMAMSGDMGQSKHFHVQAHFAPQIHAIDATGVDRMLTKHADTFQRHFSNTLRRMNK